MSLPQQGCLKWAKWGRGGRGWGEVGRRWEATPEGLVVTASGEIGCSGIGETPGGGMEQGEALIGHGTILDMYSPGAKLENGGLPYTESPLSFDGFN